MTDDIFLKKLEQDLPKYPYYITNWNEVRIDEDGELLNDKNFRYLSPNKEIEMHLEKRDSVEFFHSESESASEKYIKIDSEYYTFYNVKKRVSNLFSTIVHYNYYRKDGPARIEKTYNYKKKTTSYYCRWYPNLRGIMCRQHGPATYRVSINDKNELEILSFEWLKDKHVKHRLFAPAIYSFNKYKWFYDNREYSSYNYWKMMIEKYPRKYKKTYEDDAKIVIESKAPSPSILYKKNKNAVWKLNNKIVSMKKYWDAQIERHLYILE